MRKLPADSWIGVFAHPDDEWLAGWPIFQHTDVRLGVVFFVGDNGPTPSLGSSHWEPNLRSILSDFNIELLGCLKCLPKFYQSPRQLRTLWRDKLEKILSSALSGEYAGSGVITHNPLGEYGHPDHIEVHRAVVDICDTTPLVITDLVYGQVFPRRINSLYYQGKSHGPYHLDKGCWDAARRAYQNSLHWTVWDVPQKSTARLYEL